MKDYDILRCSGLDFTCSIQLVRLIGRSQILQPIASR